MLHCNVVEFPSVEAHASTRQVVPMSLENFCLVDATGDYQAREVINGFIILQFPRMAMICAPDGSCVINAVADTDIEAYLDVARLAAVV